VRVAGFDSVTRNRAARQEARLRPSTEPGPGFVPLAPPYSTGPNAGGGVRWWVAAS
jgi:hypothetical protein